MTIYKLDPTKTAADYRLESLHCRRKEQESFERSDTDGALSQWGHSQMARIYEALASLAEDGGMHNFCVLADLEGNEVHAKQIPTKYGTSCWAILDDNDEITGEFLPWNPARKSTLKKKGYQEIYVSKPAVVATSGKPGSYQIQIYYLPAREQEE